MSNEMNEINIGVGLGEVTFGMTRDQVQVILGKPDEVELVVFEEEDEDQTEIFHYDEMGMSLTFDADEDWRLTMITSSDEIKLKGEPILGYNLEKVKGTLTKLGYDTIYEDEEDGDLMYFLEEDNINIWFDEGISSEIQWGVFYNENDEPEFK